MEAHSGLRGLMALHVAVFHYMMSPAIQINTFGNADMSFFILLSGFGLSAAYGGKTTIDKRAFYLARFARTMPLAYLTHAAVALLTPLGHGQHPADFYVTLRNNIAATSMWVLHDGEPCWGWNGPAWTISTLVAFYWLYPFLAPTISRLAGASTVSPRARLAVGLATTLAVAHGVIGWMRPDQEKDAAQDNDDEPWQPTWLASGHRGIALGLLIGLLAGLLAARPRSPDPAARWGVPPWVSLLAWLQFAIGVGMTFNGLPLIGAGYWPATGWVPSRLPLFLMGAVAGAACLDRGSLAARQHDGATSTSDGSLSQRSWARRTDQAAVTYVGTIVACSVYEYLKEHVYKEELPNLHLGPLVQLVTPYLQLMLAIGLTRTCDSNMAAVCLHPWCQWLGKVSMGLYLGHMPVYQWLVVLVNGPADWTLGGKVGATKEEFKAWHKACHRYKKLHGHHEPGGICELWRDSHNLGAWAAPIATLLALVVAAVLEKYVETPARLRLRSWTATAPRAEIKRPSVHVELTGLKEGIKEGEEAVGLVKPASPQLKMKAG